MNIVQISETLAYGNAITNCMLSISEILGELGFSNKIMTFYADTRIKARNIIIGDIYKPLDIDSYDIIIYHFYRGNSVNYMVENLPGKKILVYHNVTPPDFFRGINDDLVQNCLWGIYDASKTVGKYLKCITLSEFSKNNLLEMGWKDEDIVVLPLIKIGEVLTEKNQEIIDKYTDDYVNILFTGSIIPHKKIEDIIHIFSYYQKNFNSKSRLLLVGGNGYQNYYNALVDYIYMLKVDNVIFTGHISNEDLEAYYAVSNAFLCMSEHEGFCIPIAEAMKRKIPVIAYSATAVRDTLGDAGILVKTKDEREIASYINQLMRDSEYREEIINAQNKRVKSLSLDAYKLELKKLIEEIYLKETYSYAFEEKRISVCYKEHLTPSYLSDLANLSHNKNKVVIYGIGKVGKSVVAECEKSDRELIRKLIICDNAFEGANYREIPVIRHRECVEQYPEALYIVTAQKECVSIIADLINDGIEKKNIVFFNNASKKIM